MSEPVAQESAPPPPKKERRPPPSPKPRHDNQNANLTCAEMIDLALSPTEIGAVNFNILRILLHHMCEKTGIDKDPVKVNDVDANQVQNFKDYVQGASVPSPMPGVLRLGQRGPAPAQNDQNQQQYPEPSQGQNQGNQPQRKPEGERFHPQRDREGGGGERERPTQSKGPEQQQQPQQPQGHRDDRRPHGQHGQGQEPRHQGQGQEPQPKGQNEAQRQPPPQGQGQKEPRSNPQGQRPAQNQGQGREDQPHPQSSRKSDERNPDTPRGTGAPSKGQGQQQQQPRQPRPESRGPPPPHSPVSGGSSSPSRNPFPFHPQELMDKVDYLEKQLEHLYTLPGNTEIIEKAKAEGTSVSDMWQIIQLNNRIAAAEAAIQKMASLIEDIAKNMGKMGSEAKILKKEAEGLQATTSEVAIKGQDLSGQMGQFNDALSALQKELNEVKKGWKNDRENMEQVLGVDLGRVPSFMKPKVRTSPRSDGVRTSPRSDGVRTSPRSDTTAEGTPSQMLDRGTQTFHHHGPKPMKKKPPEQFVPPEEIAKLSPHEIRKTITPEEVKQMTPQVFKELTPEQKKAVSDVRKSIKHMVPPQAQKQRQQQQQQKPKPKIGVAEMTPEEIEDLHPTEIAEKMPYEEAAQLPPEVLEKMTEEQKEHVQKVIKKGPTPVKKKVVAAPRKSMGVAQMSDDQIHDLPPEEIMKKMSYEEAMELPESVLNKMNDEQKAAVKKVMVQEHPEATPAEKKKKMMRKPTMGLALMTKDQLRDVSAEDIADHMPYEEAKYIPPAVLEKLAPEKQEAVKKIVNKGPPKGYKERPEKKKRRTEVGIASMSETELNQISHAQIAEMPFEEAKNIPEQIFEKLTEPQKEAIKQVIDAGPPPPSPEEEVYSDPSDEEIPWEEPQYYDDDEDGYYEEPRKSDGAPAPTPSSKRKSQAKSEGSKKTVSPTGTAGSKRKSDWGVESLPIEEIENIAEIPPEEIATTITPEQAVAIPKDEMQKRFTLAQQREVEKLKKKYKKKKAQENKLDVKKAAVLTPDELQAELTEENVLGLTEEDIDALPPAQAVVVRDFKKSVFQEASRSGYISYSEDSDFDLMGVSAMDTGPSDFEVRKSKRVSRRQTKKQVKKHRSKSKMNVDDKASDPHHTQMDILKGPIPAICQQLPPVTIEDYLSTLTPEQASNLAAEAVQKELEKQYKHLQGMQRQLAMDIQAKMEFIYDKLLKEIAAQSSTTPYMAIGEPDNKNLGPGVCTGHGMPPGIAVCQFPDATDKRPGSAVPAGEVCPGPGVCPASTTCPHCGGTESQLPAGLKGTDTKDRKGSAGSADGKHGPKNEIDHGLLNEMKSLILLDLEKLRGEMRSKKMGFNEQDVAERVGALWEALKILKHNEEAMAVKIARQDAFIKKLPPKLQNVTDENLDALISGKPPQKGPQLRFDKDRDRRSTAVGAVGSKNNMLEMPAVLKRSTVGSSSSVHQGEDIQTLYNNLANVIAECAEVRERVDLVAEAARILESETVTKQMLVEALGDKADKGALNTKVSYDEFGSSLDELNSQLHEMMVENFQRNENWKKVTNDLASELREKLDKVELAPLRQFFKNHLKRLDDKVQNLTNLIEEPDPAGTRKKLLKDYNCLSCDRAVNISGVTNGPTLPTIGPILAGHPTASRRALDLHRMRMLQQFDPARKSINALERQKRQNAKMKNALSSAKDKKDEDLVHSVNRYTGGSHTEMTNADIIAAQRRPSKQTEAPIISGTSAQKTGGNGNPEGAGGDNVAAST